MTDLATGGFDVNGFLLKAGSRQGAVRASAKQRFFAQGSHAGCIFYLQAGRARLTVDTTIGKVATVMLLVPGEFFGEESLVGDDELYRTSAAAITECTAIKLGREQMIRAMHQEDAFSAYFLDFLLARLMRVKADLTDQLFNSTERRLARMLLLLADRDQAGDSVVQLPRITQATLAELIGTTRSQVNLFMNRFRDKGMIEYKGRIRVKRSLLKSVLEE